jgi:hypothetical protein
MESAATAKIGKLTLQLSPLEERDLAPARAATLRLGASIDHGPLSDEWLSACDQVLGFVFLSARKNHPDLSLAELYDEATPQEIVAALGAVSEVSCEHWLGVLKQFQN